MPIGGEQAYTAASLNTELEGLATRMHDLMNDALAFFQNVNVLGTTGLESSPIGMLPQDAADFQTATGYLNTIAEIWAGTATQSVTFAFDTNPVIVRARGLLPQTGS